MALDSDKWRASADMITDLRVVQKATGLVTQRSASQQEPVSELGQADNHHQQVLNYPGTRSRSAQCADHRLQSAVHK